MSRQVEASQEELARAYLWLAATRRRPSPTRLGDDHDGPRRQRTAESLLRALVATFEQGEPCMRGHAERVAALSQRLAVLVGLTHEEAEVVGQAGLLHDVGKVGVARSDDDNAPVLLNRHPIIGAQLVGPFEFLALAAPMIRHHHERMDGRGYPDGLRGLTIPVGARIIAVADEYDRLTAPTSPAVLTHDAALEQLARVAGRTLDSIVVSALIEPPAPSLTLRVAGV